MQIKRTSVTVLLFFIGFAFSIQEISNVPVDYWDGFPNSGIEKIVVKIEKTKVSDPVLSLIHI